MRFGTDRIDEFKKVFQGKRLGLITNPTGVDSKYRPTVEKLYERFNLVKLFGPEHGISGENDIGIQVGHSVNRKYGLPEYSLYGKQLRLTDEMLAGLDAMVFDIQDVGARFYTYTSTLTDAMEDCAKAGVSVIVLDRPNPLGGVLREGTLLRPKFASFIGRYPIPTRHGLTVGEYAKYINAKYHLNCDLTVIPCAGWKRAKMHTGSWLNPSPNMPSFDCALVYPGTCLFEATNLSQGRGITRPFEIIGAPFLPAEKVAKHLNSLRLPGVIFRPCIYRPNFHTYQGETCFGIQLHLTNRHTFRPWACGLRMYETMKNLVPEFIDKGSQNLIGDDVLKNGTESVDSLIQRGIVECEQFSRDVADFLLYE